MGMGVVPGPSSPETVRGSRDGKCREISGEILRFPFPLETKLESAQKFSRQISRHFSPDALQLQMPNFMAFFILQTFVLDNPPQEKCQFGGFLFSGSRFDPHPQRRIIFHLILGGRRKPLAR